MSNYKDLFARLTVVVIALLMAVGVLALVKFVLVPEVTQSGEKIDQIWQIEIFVVLAILGAFIIQSGFGGMMKIMQWVRDRESPLPDNSYRISPLVLILSFTASVLLYLVALTWIKEFLG